MIMPESLFAVVSPARSGAGSATASASSARRAGDRRFVAERFTDCMLPHAGAAVHAQKNGAAHPWTAPSYLPAVCLGGLLAAGGAVGGLGGEVADRLLDLGGKGRELLRAGVQLLAQAGAELGLPGEEV